MKIQCWKCHDDGMLEVYLRNDPFYTAVCRCDCAMGNKYQSFPHYRSGGAWVLLKYRELAPFEPKPFEPRPNATAKDCHFELK